MQSIQKYKRQTIENEIEVVLPKQMIIQPTKKGQKQVCSVLNTDNEIIQGEMFPIVRAANEPSYSGSARARLEKSSARGQLVS